MRNKIHDSLDLMICDSLFFGLPVFFCLYRLYRLRKALITEFIFEQSFISLSSGEKIYYNDVGSVLSVGLVVVFTHGKAIKSYDSIFTNSQNELDFVIRKLDRFKINENAKHDL